MAGRRFDAVPPGKPVHRTAPRPNGDPGMEPASSLREPTRPVTGDELLCMPRSNPCELVAGRIVSMTPTSPAHGRPI